MTGNGGANVQLRGHCEITSALGKHWDRPVQGGDATVAQLVQAWLRAERVRDLVVLRAHHLVGPEGTDILVAPALSLHSSSSTAPAAASVGTRRSSRRPEACGPA